MKLCSLFVIIYFQNFQSNSKDSAAEAASTIATDFVHSSTAGSIDNGSVIQMSECTKLMEFKDLLLAGLWSLFAEKVFKSSSVFLVFDFFLK